MTHTDLITLCAEPWITCRGQLARLGAYLAPEWGRRAIPIITVFHCPTCDRVIEVRFHGGPWHFAKLVRSYIYSTAVLPRLRRPR